ncbi:MAG: Hsp20/alpha crystallin family protein [Candidatus Omnitrophica bacterium]|nr:Hsp20/alpha crystallin family protein [Candidatus Omnitrophota bacterium]
MTTEHSDKKMKTLYGVIVLLLLAIVVETGILIQQQRTGSEAKSDQQVSVERGLEPSRTPVSHPANSKRQNYSPMQRFYQRSGDPYWDDPFAIAKQMQSRMDQLMSSLMTYRPSFGTSLDDTFDFSLAIDLEDTKDAYIIRSDIPGLEKDKINITVQDNLLTIQGIRESVSQTENDQSGYFAQERSYGSFSRSINLPGPVDDTNINAKYENGVLVITLPKADREDTRMKKVSIQ